MKVNLIRIGNSKGIRIPKPLIEQCGIGETVEITVRGNVLEVSPARKIREGWEESFKEMARRGDDVLLDGEEEASDWDKAEWRW